MQLKHIIIPIASLVMASACSKKLAVTSPDGLTVSVMNQKSSVGDTLYYNLGDTVRFMITGNADNIIFYSGELTHNYLYANRTGAAGVPQMSFTSNAQYGTQTNTLQVLATDKLTKVDSAHIVTASWIDITSRASLSTGAGAVASGTINLSDLVTGPADSLFLAFKYNGVTGSTQKTWTITGLTVNNVLADSTPAPLLNLTTDATWWTRFNIYPPAANWVPSTTQLSVTGGSATAPTNTAWIVSRPIYVNQVNPDLPVVIKQLASTIPVYTAAGVSYAGYNYVYAAKRGLYMATFVYFNTSIDEQKTLVKKFYIRIN